MNGTVYKGIYGMKFLMAILVVIIHTTDWGLGGLTDVAVPYFFLVSGFLLFRKIRGLALSGQKSAILKWTWRAAMMYLVWTLIYMPFTIYGMCMDHLTLRQALLQFIRNFIIVGHNYLSWPLWYLLSLVWCGVLIYLMKSAKIPLWMMFIISAIAYIAVRESGVMDTGFWHRYIMDRKALIPLGMFYITAGGLLQGGEEFLQKDTLPRFLLPSICLVAAVAFTFLLKVSDWFLFPLAVSLFILSVTINLERIPVKAVEPFGYASKIIYLTHMIFAGVLTIFLPDLGAPKTFAAVLLASCLLSLALIGVRRHFKA